VSNVKTKVKRLADEEEDIKDVLERILGVQAEKGVVNWADVSDDATSGQWGRLIEKGVLVDAESGDGFVVDDADEVRDLLGIEEGEEEGGLSIGEDVPDVEDVDTSWSIYDKMAAGFGLGVILFGYRDEGFRELVGGAINSVILPLHESLGVPYYIIIMLFAVVTGLYSSYLQLYLMDWDWIKAQQKKVKAIQSELKEAQMEDDDAREEELREEQMGVMSEQLKMFKMQFRPSVWIMSMTIPIFLWLLWSFSNRLGGTPHIEDMPEMVMPFVGEVALNTQVIGLASFFEAWLVWYIVCSFGFGQVMRKALGVNPTS